MRALVLFALLGGCAYTHPLNVADAEHRQALSERATRQVAVVAVQGEPPGPVDALSIRADSTSWIDAATGVPRSVATPDLALVRFPSSERRPLRTFVAGLVGGALVGGAIGVAAFEREGPSLLAESQRESAVLFGMLFGALGGAAGGLVALDGLNPVRYVPADSTAPR